MPRQITGETNFYGNTWESRVHFGYWIARCSLTIRHWPIYINIYAWNTRHLERPKQLNFIQCGVCDIVAYTKIYFHRFCVCVCACFSFCLQRKAQHTEHIDRLKLAKNVCSFFSTWCPHFYFTLTILSIVEKWSHHIDLTKKNRHILRVVYAHCMTNEKQMPKKHQIQETTKHTRTHTIPRNANGRRK